MELIIIIPLGLFIAFVAFTIGVEKGYMDCLEDREEIIDNQLEKLFKK